MLAHHLPAYSTLVSNLTAHQIMKENNHYYNKIEKNTNALPLVAVQIDGRMNRTTDRQ